MDNSITISNVKSFVLIRSILNLIYSCMHGFFLILLLSSDPKSIVWSSQSLIESSLSMHHQQHKQPNTYFQ